MMLSTRPGVQTPILSLSGYTATAGRLAVETISMRTGTSPLFVSLCAPSGPAGKHTRSPASSSSSPLRVADREPALEHEQPLLVGLVVVRAIRLAGRDDVVAAGHRLAADERRDLELGGAVALGVGVVVLRFRRVEVEPSHHRSRS